MRLNLDSPLYSNYYTLFNSRSFQLYLFDYILTLLFLDIILVLYRNLRLKILDESILYRVDRSCIFIDIIESYGNRYILIVSSHLSYGQNSTNRLYLSIDIPPKLWIETKSIEKSAKCATNTDLIPTSINTI